MKLENLPKRKNRTFKGKRIGRGYGSGVGGHTATRGSKGQKSRSGHKSLVMFEGGNVPFYRRMPKYKGFSRPFKIEYEVVNVAVLNEEFKTGETVNLDTLREKALIQKRTTHVKILGSGDLDKKLTIEGLALSESARDKVLGAKGVIKEVKE
ncbi:MAG: 50S ribosomal protein L15 [Candidatus Dojkabacteria bacterium]|nr:MAG: 50S ribosomal protein L15 [Candidatus Dojkabacteria bacterium]